MTQNSWVKPPEDWTTLELFNYCVALRMISPDEKFEDWKHDRPDLLKMVKEDIASN